MRKEEATGIQDKQANFPPQRKVVKNIDTNPCWPVACGLSALPGPSLKLN